MNLKKTLLFLLKSVENLTEKEVQNRLLIILESYEMQNRYGQADKLIAFSNSIYTPTSRQNQEKESAIKQKKLNKKCQKQRIVDGLKDYIKEFKSMGTSNAVIAKLLSKHYIPNHLRARKKQYIDEKTIERYCHRNFIKTIKKPKSQSDLKETKNPVSISVQRNIDGSIIISDVLKEYYKI